MLAAIALFIAALELGPALGTSIPEPERFEEAMGELGATIVFVRSVDWCPYCKTQVMELGDEAQAFAQAGRPLVFVSYDTAEKQQAFAEMHDTESTFIADEGSEIIKAFGLLNEEHRPGSRAYGIPHPAVFIVDRDGTVRRKLYEEDYATNAKSYRERPAVATILAAAEGAR